MRKSQKNRLGERISNGGREARRVVSWRANEEVGGGEGHGGLSLMWIESEPWV